MQVMGGDSIEKAKKLQTNREQLEKKMKE